MTETSASGATAPMNVVVVGGEKSMGLAILLAFLFGPLGLLYASALGGLVMIVLSVVLGFFTMGLGLLITWPLCVVWAVVAVIVKNRGHAAAVRGALAA